WIAYAVSGTIGRPVIRTVPHCADDWKTGEAVRAPFASTYLGRHARPPVTFSATAARPAGGVASSQREPRAAALIEHDVCSHASVASLQLSVVQETPSPQLTGTPGWQLPPPQTSLPLQNRPSPHGSVLFEFTQPVPDTHVSVVQRLPSSQSAFVTHVGAGGKYVTVSDGRWATVANSAELTWTPSLFAGRKTQPKLLLVPFDQACTEVVTVV